MQPSELETKHGLTFSFDDAGVPQVNQVLDPHHNPDQMLRAAVTSCMEGNVEEGIIGLKKLLGNPEFKNVALQNLSNSYYQLKDYHEALSYASKSLDLEYLNDFTHRTLTKIYIKLGEFKKAEEHLIINTAINNPEGAQETGILTGEILGYNNHYQEYHRQAIMNLSGSIFIFDKKVDSSFKYDFTRRFIDEGEVGDTEFRSDILHGIFGDLDDTSIRIPVIVFEYGWLKTLNLSVLPYTAKEWSGQNLDGKSILVHSEQGLGDNILRLRYLEQLKKKYDCKVICVTYHNMRDIKDCCSCVDDYCPMLFDISRLATVDYTINIYKLANYFDLVYDGPLFKENEKYPIDKGDKPIVIVNWLARRYSPTLSDKEINLVDFSGLLRAYSDRFDFYTCQPKNQKKRVVEDIESFKLPVQYLESQSISQLLSYISQSAFVISIDTLHAHAAGALGKTTFVLCPNDIMPPFWGTGIHVPYYDKNFYLLRGSSNFDQLSKEIDALKMG